MTRLLRALVSLAIGAAVLLLAGPAEAAETYTWVAAGPGTFTNPANWEDASGDPGVPGSDDTAVITDPAGTVTVDADVIVSSFTLVASLDDQTDLVVPFDSDLAAEYVTADGDLFIQGRVLGREVTLGGTVMTAGSQNVVLLEDTTPEEYEPGTLTLVDLTGPTGTLLFVGGAGPSRIEVAGSSETTVRVVATTPAAVSLDGPEGGVLTGRLYLREDATISGDVAPGLFILVGEEDGHPVSLTWEGEEAELDGWLGQFTEGPLDLPDRLAIDGLLDLRGPASGGSVDIGPEGALRFTDEGTSGHGEADLVLSDSFASDATGGIWVEPADGTCVGDEALLIRAAGGVAFPPGEMHVDAPPTWFEFEGVALRDELVAVSRRTSGEVDDTCLAGGSERVARAMFRDLLGRRADTGGAGYWGRKLDGGMEGSTVASRLLATDKARVHLIESTWAEWACDGEPPSDLAVAMGVEYLRGGGSLPALRADVVASTIPSDGDPVVCLYRAALGRNPDPGGRAYVEGRLESESAQKVSRRLVMSAEGRRVRFNRLYQDLLARDAQPEEVADAVAAIQSGRTEPWVTAQIAGTTEYLERNSR